ncbi:MAG: peptidylprolyl isomerase, partial [Planctomycetota bacterium]
MARKDARQAHRVAGSETSPRTSRRWLLGSIAILAITVCAAVKSVGTAPEANAQSPANQAAASQPVRQASAQSPAEQPIPEYQPPQHDVMAIVNGQDINRQQLAQACIERFGEDVLESLVNKRLIEHRCRNRGITVTDADIEAEVDRIAKRFKLDREQWLGLLEKERGVKPEEYKRDILWPTIALRRLAGTEIQVTQDELLRAYETRFGPKVQVRLIVLSDGKRAAQLQRQLAARSDDFARVAMQESEDVNSASIGGLIQPISLHVGDPLIEQAAFALERGQVSSVIQVENQFAIIKCENKIPPRKVAMEEVRSSLQEQIKEEKLRQVAGTVFEAVQKTATVKNVYNDPTLRNQMPGVVATVNGEQITMRELGA